MIVPAKHKKLVDYFNMTCQNILSGTKDKILNQSPGEKQARKRKAMSSYQYFFETYFAHYCDNGTTPCAPFHIEAAHKIKENPIITAFLIWHRGAAKSVHSTLGYPMWLMLQGEMKFMVLMGFNEKKANRLLSDIQAELQNNQLLIADFGQMFSYGDWSKGSFITADGTAFEAISIMQDPSGLRNGAHRPDYVIVDDVDNAMKSRNKEWVHHVCGNITGSLAEGMSKDKQRFVVAQNYKVKKGILYQLLSKLKDSPETYISLVPAVNPDGTPTWNRYTKEYWEKKKAKINDDRVWNGEYMHNPTEGGTVFNGEWYVWNICPKLEEFESVTVHCDLSYTNGGDYKAIAVIGKKDRKFYLVELFGRRCDIQVAVAWLYDYYKKYLTNVRCLNMYYEGTAAQKKIYGDEFNEEGDKRGWYLPIMADMNVVGNKYDRIEKLTRYYKEGRLIFNAKYNGANDSEWEEMLNQFENFEMGSTYPDDIPDAIAMCMNRANDTNTIVGEGTYIINQTASFNVLY